MIRQVLAIVVLMRLSTSLALILLEGASSLLQAAAFMIALIGFAPVGVVIGGMISSGRDGDDDRPQQLGRDGCHGSVGHSSAVR